MKKYIPLIYISVFSSTIFASEETPKIMEPLSVGSMLQVFSGLIAVLLLFGGLIFVLKRMGGFRGGQSARMNVVDAVSVGTRDRVLLLQVGEKQVLIGVSPSGISPITVFDETVISASETTEKSFSGQLQNQLSKRLNKESKNDKDTS